MIRHHDKDFKVSSSTNSDVKTGNCYKNYYYRRRFGCHYQYRFYLVDDEILSVSI